MLLLQDSMIRMIRLPIFPGISEMVSNSRKSQTELLSINIALTIRITMELLLHK